MKRINNLSSRHSRFGATIAVKGKSSKMSQIVSKPNYSEKDLYTFKEQRVKPKPAARYNSTMDSFISKNCIITQLEGILTQEEKVLKVKLQKFALDFLESSFNSLITASYSFIYKNQTTFNVQEKDYIAFFVVAAFGMESYSLGIEFKMGVSIHSQIS